MVVIRQVGDFHKTEQFLEKVKRRDIYSVLEKYADAGVQALSSATPIDTGVTANSWSYTIEKSRGSIAINWTNSHTVNGVPLVILLQYGHGTGTGGYVQGRDFINPAIQPVMDQIAEDLWREVTSA